MTSLSRDQVPRIMLIGVGDLTMRLAHLLASSGSPMELIIASRTIDRATRFANLVKFAAANLGHFHSVNAIELDLSDISRTADDLRRAEPSLIFMGASIQAARAIMDLPSPLFRRLDEAQLGPWLPMHLTLTYELMQAVRAAGSESVVVNGAYPDAVGPALASVGLAPHVGIGNVGNVVPGITWAIAGQLGVRPEQVEIKIVAHHYFSHHVHRFGEANGIPHILHASVDGQSAEVDAPQAFAALAAHLRRQGGKDGQQLTATSAARVILALLSDDPRSAHAPAPDGHIGGFPILVSRAGVEISLPPGLDLGSAEEINRRCQQLDGIDTITANGTIQFMAERMAVMRDLLGYHCTELKVSEARAAAQELKERYEAFLDRNALRGPDA